MKKEFKSLSDKELEIIPSSLKINGVEHGCAPRIFAFATEDVKEHIKRIQQKIKKNNFGLTDIDVYNILKIMYEELGDELTR